MVVAQADDPAAPDRLARLREAVLAPVRNVYCVSDKVLSNDPVHPAPGRWVASQGLGGGGWHHDRGRYPGPQFPAPHR
jgi:hypothetical protein